MWTWGQISQRDIRGLPKPVKIGKSGDRDAGFSVWPGPAKLREVAMVADNPISLAYESYHVKVM